MYRVSLTSIGAERLVKHLHKHNIPIALATSSGEDSVEVKTRNHRELFELFGHKVMGSSDAEVKEGKPAPDIFLVAASRFPDTPKPEQVIFLCLKAQQQEITSLKYQTVPCIRGCS